MDTTEEKIETHERLTRVEEKMDTVLTNHLPHLKETIDRIDERLWYVITAIIISTLLGIGVSIWVK